MNANLINKRLLLLGCVSTWCFIFFSVVPYAIAGKHIATGFMAVAFIFSILRRQIAKVQPDWLTVSGMAVIGFALLSAALSPYAGDALNQFRKDALPFLMGFLLLVSAPKEDLNRTMVFTMLSLILGYAVKEILAFWSGAENGWQFSIYEIPDARLPKYLDFFSADTPYYLPFLLGPLFLWPMRLWQRLILSVLSVLAIAIVVVSGVRTSFVLVATSTILIPMVRFWHKKMALCAVLAVLALCGYLLKSQIVANPSIARYTSIASTQTYQFGKDGSVSERYAIIKGVWEVSKDRLLLGYGPGWKKLPTVAEANGHMARWRESSEDIDKLTLNYFSNGEGRVNPHNFYMGLLFENGVLGLIAYIAFMFAALAGALKLSLRSSGPLERGVGVASALYLIVYFGGSFTGGSWLPVTMLVAVTCLALCQGKSAING